jgi:hypothetical protein
MSRHAGAYFEIKNSRGDYWTGSRWSTCFMQSKHYPPQELPEEVDGHELLKDKKKDPVKWEYIATCGSTLKVVRA